MNVRLPLVAIVLALVGLFLFDAVRLSAREKEALRLTLRSRPKDKDGRFPVVTKEVAWEPKKTALIICDMWDDHWCKSASRRVGEMAGPLNDVVKTMRAKGVFVIHAPSSVTAFYKDTPGRKLAKAAKFA